MLSQKEESNCSAFENFSQVLFTKKNEVTVPYEKLGEETKINLWKIKTMKKLEKKANNITLHNYNFLFYVKNALHSEKCNLIIYGPKCM